MNTKNWKSLGWLVTRKLVYYALFAVGVVYLLTQAAALLSMASSLAVIGGVVLIAIVLGTLFTFVVSEVSYYSKRFSS